MKKNILTAIALTLLLVVGVYFKHQEEPTELDKQKVAAMQFVDAMKSCNVEKVIANSKDLRFSTDEERRKTVGQQFEQDKIVDAGIAGYVRDGNEQNMRAAIWYETEHLRKQQINLLLVEDKGRWKILLGEAILQGNPVLK